MAIKVAWTEHSGRNPPLEVEVGKGVEVELGSSELAEATPPRMVAANAQTSRRLLTTLGKLSSWPNTHVWFVRPKLRSPSVTGTMRLWVCSPIDTLRERRTERVGAGALEDIEESARVEDYLEDHV